VPETDNSSLVIRSASRGSASETGKEFERFVLAHRNNLVRGLRYVGATTEEAEDAVQDALMEVMRRGSQVEFEMTYAQTAALHSFMKTRARERRRPEKEESSGLTALPPDRQGDIHHWESWQQVLDLLKTFPRGPREIFALLVDEYSQEEVAEVLNRSYPAIRQALCAGRRAVRSQFEPDTLQPAQQNETPAPRDEA
jgi:RNA polymerase sigma factor (sigma-70 family)